MMGVRFARAARRRPLIVKFEGSYHGSYDDVSWSTGPSSNMMGDSRNPTPVADSAGLVSPDGRTIVLPFNDPTRLEEVLGERHDEIAGILVEPLANRMGLIPPDPAFLLKARELCDRYGVLLLFDEVIAFRLGYHGAQGELGITPDITTLGKVIGGGFPVGAVAGRADILDLSAASGSERVAHTGTFNGNPMMAAAGYATMSGLQPEVFARMNAMGARLRGDLTRICEGAPLQVSGAGSVFKITAIDRPVRNYRDSVMANKAWEQLAALALLNEGFFVTTALSGCVSAVTTDTHIADFTAAFRAIASA
jgi:glutamate-1-semialdehyde 2,1-aminomutase